MGLRPCNRSHSPRPSARKSKPMPISALCVGGCDLRADRQGKGGVQGGHRTRVRVVQGQCEGRTRGAGGLYRRRGRSRNRRRGRPREHVEEVLQLEILAHFLVGNGGFDLVLPSPSGPVPDELRRWCNGWQEAGAQAAEFRDGEGLREPCDYAAAVWSSGPVSFRLQNAARR